MHQLREVLEQSVRSVVAATDPYTLTRQQLPAERPSFILAVGKAAVPMANAALERSPGTPYLVVTRDGYDGGAVVPDMHVAAHPVPDHRSEQAGAKALHAVRRLGDDEHLLVLISGGGSSLVSVPWGITLAQKREVNEALLRSGADITEINTVRKHLSRIKGGQLLAATRARVTTLILSDVPGDDISSVASGPTVADPTTFAQAYAVLDRYSLDLPEVRAHLESGISGVLDETPKPADLRERSVENIVIGTGWTLMQAAKRFWSENHPAGAGADIVVLSDSFTGEAADLAAFHASIVRSIRRHAAPTGTPAVLLSGGEASVTVNGDGRGGRNQEFALALTGQLADEPGWAAIAVDTDGIDGNTEAAGAVTGSWTSARPGAQAAITNALAANDSHQYFADTGGLVVTGPIQNNLNDYRAILVDPQENP